MSKFNPKKKEFRNSSRKNTISPRLSAWKIAPNYYSRIWKNKPENGTTLYTLHSQEVKWGFHAYNMKQIVWKSYRRVFDKVKFETKP